MFDSVNSLVWNPVVEMEEAANHINIEIVWPQS